MDIEKANAYAGDYLTKLAVDREMDKFRAERQAQEEEEWKNKSFMDRMGEISSDAISTAADVGANVASIGKEYVSSTWDAAVNAVDKWNKVGEGWREMLHQSANMQEAMQNGTFSQENVSNMQQSAENYMTDLNRLSDAGEGILRAPTRPLVRAFVNANAENADSPYFNTASSWAQSEAYIKYYMTDEERLAKSRAMEEKLHIPAEITSVDDKAFKAALQVYNFMLKEQDVDKVWEEFPEIKTIAEMDPQAAALALHDIDTSRKTKGIIESFTTGYTLGNQNLEYDMLQFKMAIGQADDNDRQRAEDLKKIIAAEKKKPPSMFDAPLDAMAYGVAQSVPDMSSSYGKSAALASLAIIFATGGAGAAALAEGTGVRAALLQLAKDQAFRTVLKRLFVGGSVAGMGVTAYGRDYEALGEYKDKEGKPLFTDAERRRYAAPQALVEAGIEVGSDLLTAGVAKSALIPKGHLGKVAADIIENTTTSKTMTQKTMEILGSRGKDWLKMAAMETGEEGAQSVSNDLFTNAYLYGKGEQADHIHKFTAGEIANRAVAQMMEAVPGAVGFGMVPAVGGSIVSTGAMARQVRKEAKIAQEYGENIIQTMQGTVMVEQLQQAVASGKLKETAPDVQQKILREQLKDTGYETAYIDVETALQKETGVEDLRKVADKAGMSQEDLQTAIDEKGFIPVPVEVLAQVESTPDLLDSISFKESAESMARMRMNQKELRESYQAALKQVMDNKFKNIDNIIAQAIPNATKEQKEMLEEIIMTNLDNPAQGFKAVRAATQQELDEILAPAIKALEAGAGKAHPITIKDEQGNDKTIYTPGENEPWYSAFHNQFGHYPTKAEFRDMAIALVTGDPSAPKVMNWTVDSLEQQQAMENNKGLIDRLQARLKTLQEIKPEVEKLTGVEMQLTEGLTPEGFSMYRQIFDWLKNVGGATARQARMGAILAARHADIYAAKVTERTGKKYTALDYMHDKIGFSVRRADAGLNQMAGINARNINAQQLQRAKEMLAQGKNMDAIFKETGWLQGADGKWRFEIPDNLDKISWKGIGTNASLWQVYDNERLYDAYPWLASVSVKLVDLAEGHNGRVTGGVYRLIEINKNISDKEKSSALVHEIQHMIQEKEGFASGGSMNQVRGQIERQKKIMARQLSDIPQGKEYVETNNDLLTALLNGDDVEALMEKMNEINDSLPEKARDQIDKISSLLARLEGADEIKDDYNLYHNLGGEQEARETQSRAGQHTKIARAREKALESERKLQEEVKKLSPDLLKKYKEFQQLDIAFEENRGLDKAEEERYFQLRDKVLPKELLDAFDEADWDALDYEEEASTLKVPVPHDENAIIVFDGQEMAMAMPTYTITGDEDVEFKPDNNASYRFTAGTNPMSRAGYAMFADNIESVAYSYGRNAFKVEHENLMPVEKVQELVRAYIKENDDFFEDIRNEDGNIDLGEAEKYIEDINPPDIVDGAGAFDNEDFVEWLWENILEPNDVWGIKTNDGAIVFDENMIKPDFEASVYYGNPGDEILAPISVKDEVLNQRASEKPQYNPRSMVPKVRGGWNEKKILKYLKENSTPSGVHEAAKLIAEFDSVEELKQHMFFHGSPGGSAHLKPSITMSDREIERMGGGGYGEKYWGISVTPSKKIAANFSSDSRSVNIYPLILAKNAVVEENPELKDAIDIEESIVDYWTRGVDAVWIGDKNAGEQELLILNPRAVVNIGTADTYRVFKLGQAENPLKIKDDKEIAKMLEIAKDYVENRDQYRPQGKPKMPSRFMDEDMEVMKPKEQYAAEKAEYDKALKEWEESEQARTYKERQKFLRDNILFQTAWVGSPADFNKFDLGYVGTGEGVQAHGYGLYSAGDRKVAEGYRKRLAGTIKMPTFEEITVDGVSLQDMLESAIDNGEYEKQAMLENYETYNRQGVIQSAKEEGFEQEYIDWFNQIADKVEKQLPEQPGKLYEVEIPDNDVLLDEQKPFNEQPEKVRTAIIAATKVIDEEQEAITDNYDFISTSKSEKDTLEYAVKVLDEIEKILVTFRNDKESIIKKLKEYKRTTFEGVGGDFYANMINEKGLPAAILDIRKDKATYINDISDHQKEINKLNNEIENIIEKKIHEIKEEKDTGETQIIESEITGKQLYYRFEKIFHSPRKASQYLNKFGIEGITYEGGMDGRCFVIFDDKAIDIIEKYNQQVRQQQIQGQTSLQANGKRIVSILESADESTFMHEMAHVFLYDLQDLAQIDDVSAKELEIVNEWANWQKGAAAEYKSTPWAREFAQLEQEIIDAEAHGDFDLAKQKKRQWRQERFARGFELYLKDGQAPAKGLKAVFRMFKQFLRQIYAAFTSDGGKPSLPVKRVMDRMIATEQEIEAMELDDRFADVEKAGGEKLLDEKEEDTYRRFYQESEDEAKEQLLKIVMKDLEKEKQAEFDYEVAAERARKEKELQQEPIYMAEKAAMTSGSDSIVENWYPSVEAFREELANTPPLEEALQAHMDKFTSELDARLIESHLSEEAVEKAMKKSKYRTKMEALKGKAMAKKLALIKKINAKAEKAMESIEEKLTALPEDTDLKVDKDTASVKSIMKEISKLKFAAKWNKDELAHIESMIRASTQDEVRQAIKQLKENNARDKIREEEILKATEGRQAIFRDMAKAAMAGKPISESCNVGYYRSQEKKAARRVRDMLRAKRYDMALKAQEQQANFAALAELAEANKEERDKLLAQVHRELNARTVKLPKDERYWHRQLAYILRISKNEPNIPENGVRPLHELIKGMEDSLDILQGALNEMMKIASQGEKYQGYQSMTMDEFKDAVQSLHTIYVVGRDKFKMKTMQGKNLLDVVDEITTEEDTVASNIEVDRRMINADRGGLAYSELIGNTGDKGHLIAKRGQDYIASNLKPENILLMIGQKAHDYIYGTLERAAEAEAKMQAENIQKLQEIMSVYSHKERQDWSKKIYDFSTEKGDKISKEQIMCMALNWGNLSNRQRLLGGLASDERTPEAVARMTKEVMDLFQQTMTAKDWQVVQKLWDHIGSFWEDTVKVEEKLNGVTLERIEPTPFTITSSDGQEMDLAGGYVPVKYDSEKSSRAGEQAENAEVQSMLAGAQRFGVGRNFTKGRSEFDIYRPLVLDFSVVEEHLQNVIHNATYRLPVRDVYRLVTNLDFENYVVEHLGREYHNILKAWTVDAWKPPMLDNNTADNGLSWLLNKLRSNSVFAIMAYRPWPAIENISNVAVVAEKIGSAEMMAAFADFYSNRERNMESVKHKSLFMRNRIDNLDRDIRSQPGIFHAGNKLAEFVVAHGYDLMVYSDLACSAPLWMRAYKNAYEPMLDKVKAENEANIQYLIECQRKVDEIKAQIIDLTTEAGQMDEHLKARRYASPETAEALRQSPFAMHTDADLRALAGENRKKVKELEKERWQAEAAFKEAQEIKILSDDEILDEAENRAVFAADGVIRDTFGSGRNIDLPAVQRSRNEITKLLTVFYGFFNTQFNAVYMQYARSRHLPANNVIEKWMPFARTIMFRFVLTSLISSTLQFGLGLAGGSDDEKKKKVKGADGKTTEVDVPVLERFLKVFVKNTISTSVGSMYLVRDVIGVISDFVINDKTYGLNTGSVASRGVSELGKMVVLLSKKGQKDAEIQAQQEKKEKEQQEKLAKYKGKKRQEYLEKWEEDQKYVKPPKRITYAEIAGHGLKGISSLTAAQTGVTSTMVNAVTSTMQYMLDTDMRYDPSWKNIIWSALFDKKPVEREIPKKPPAEPKKNKKKKKEKN